MNIIIATGIFTPEIGGPATYVPSIAYEFISLGHEVSVITYSNTVEYSGDIEVKFPVFRVFRTNKLSNYLRYFITLFNASKKADVIYAFDHISAGIPAVAVAILRHKKLYIRVGGDFLWERFLRISKKVVSLREYYKHNLHKKDLVRFFCSKIVFRFSTGIIFTTEFQSYIFLKYYKINKRKIYYIKNPTPNIPENIRYNKKNNDIVFAGRIVAKNNLKNLIDAFLHADISGHNLVVIGSGEQKKELKKYVFDRQISSIVFKDSIPRCDLWAVFSLCHAVVFPSITDISPNTMLDCIAIGTPFISSVEIGYNWLGNDQINMFEPSDTIQIAKSLEYICSKEGHERTKNIVKNINYKYSFKEAASNTLNIFRNV